MGISHESYKQLLGLMWGCWGKERKIAIKGKNNSMKNIDALLKSASFSTECAHSRGLCTEFSQSAVWRGQPGRLWIQPLPAEGAIALLWPPVHERHAAGENAWCEQRDPTPTKPGQRGSHHWPDGRDSLLLLPQMTSRHMTGKYLSFVVVMSKTKVHTVWKQ